MSAKFSCETGSPIGMVDVEEPRFSWYFVGVVAGETAQHQVDFVPSAEQSGRNCERLAFRSPPPSERVPRLRFVARQLSVGNSQFNPPRYVELQASRGPACRMGSMSGVDSDAPKVFGRRNRIDFRSSPER